MTIETEAIVAGPYTGNGVTSAFVFAFKVFADTDLLVVHTDTDGVDTEQTLTTNYTVSRNADQDANPGGTVTWKVAGVTTALPADEMLTITSEVPSTQATALPTGGSYAAKTVERMIDKATILVKQFGRSVVRSIRQPITDTTLMNDLPNSAERADSYLYFDADGHPTAATGITAGTTVSSAMQPVVTASTLALARAAMSVVGTSGNEVIAGNKTFSGSTALSGSLAVSGATTLGAVAAGDSTHTGTFALTSDISPTQLAANTDNWAPASLSSASVIRFSTDARRSITGLTGGADGRLLTLHNVGTFPAAFKYEDANSTAANRFAFGRTLGGGQSMLVQYDATTARWRLVSAPEEVGVVKDFATSTIPEGYLAIDQNVSRTTYAALFNEIGTAFGTGDGSTTFGLHLGKGAALIAAGTGTQTDSGVNADVDTSTDTLTVASNDKKWVTGMAAVFTLASGTITGLVSTTTYYVIRNSATTVKLASTLANAQNGTAIDLTAKSSPVWTITHTYTARTHAERLGEEGHAMSSTEILAHTHTAQAAAANSANGAGTFGGNGNTGSMGGNAAMNIMQPSTVVTRGIRYC